MYDKTFEIAKKINTIVDQIENTEFDDSAELYFMESIQDICLQLYEMCLLHGNRLRDLQLKENELKLFRSIK